MRGEYVSFPDGAGDLKEIAAEGAEAEVPGVFCGVSASGDGKAASTAVEVAEEDGVNLARHRARHVDDGVLEGADLVLALSPAYQEALARKCAPRFGLFVLKEFGVEGEPPEDRTIADPAGGSKEAYRRCYREIKREIKRIFPRLGELLEEKERGPVAESGEGEEG